jgi:hypothetical protein
MYSFCPSESKCFFIEDALTVIVTFSALLYQ